MAGSVIRNYTIEVDKINKKSVFSIYPYPVEVLTPNGWENIQEEFEELQAKNLDDNYTLTPDEEQLYQEYKQLADSFYENKIASTIILDTVDPTGIDIVGRDRVQHVLDAETREQIPFGREFAYVHGASKLSGTIILPYDDYSDVYVVSDVDEDGIAELTYVKTKEETDGVRPYYEKVEGQTYIYVDHFSGGGGTQADPYIVSTEQDLNDVRKKPNAWYLQDRDIVMGSFQSGEGFTPIKSFTGIYDGGGFYIKSLYINSSTSETGLFGVCGWGGLIRNLRLIHPNISSSKSNVAALIGTAYNAKIYNCNVVGGEIIGGGNVGAIVGYGSSDLRQAGYLNTNTEIYYCYNYKCVIRTTGNNAGGIAGNLTNGYNGYIGITNVYSTGLVEDITVAKERTGIGGLIGFNSGSSFTNGFWDMEKSTCTYSALGKGLSTSEMKDMSSFLNWSFDIYWYMSEDYNEGYPEHRQFIRYSQGLGEEANPFIITTEFDLNQMRWFRQGYYFRFEDDIKMTEHQTGNGFMPIGFDLVGKEQYVKAYINGNNRSIANLFIYRPANTHVGLFGVISGGLIENLDIIDPNLTGKQYVSPFGYVSNAKLSNCHTDTFASSMIKGTFVGGLVGQVHGGAIIEDCSSNVNISTTNYGGGFVSSLGGNPIIRRCYASGKGENTGGYIAGFFGNIEDSSTCLVEDCFTNTELNGTSVGLFGGYVGRYSQGAIVRRSIAYGKGYYSEGFSGFLASKSTYESPASWTQNFWDRTLNSNAATSFGAAGITTAELKFLGTYNNSSGWDFTSLWLLEQKYNNGYPVLRKLLPVDTPILGFRNEFGKYYTDNAGERLRYLEFGTLVASQTSSPKPVWVQNNADFPVNQLKAWVDSATVAKGMEIDLSMSDTPFLPAQELAFNGILARGGAEKFYVRIKSDITVKTGGTFDLRAKASPM
ncbi:filamentous hemagglutinin [Paenibacillus kribbensis]|uniref:Filamentous hemagglutinin n=1 Tax=Paenibacillus kribbensis TaxID=172713 RepID=A0A222WPP3_9BACL|nr:filamentous hemagglutinin [Paenibacillus kribbensis]ASR48507.1 filamentous hemagglutinin [Paenibacillus kribbensis]